MPARCGAYNCREPEYDRANHELEAGVDTDKKIRRLLRLRNRFRDIQPGYAEVEPDSNVRAERVESWKGSGGIAEVPFTLAEEPATAGIGKCNDVRLYAKHRSPHPDAIAVEDVEQLRRELLPVFHLGERHAFTFGGSSSGDGRLTGALSYIGADPGQPEVKPRERADASNRKAALIREIITMDPPSENESRIEATLR